MQLTTGPMQLGGPVLSPDGKRIYATGQQRRTELVRYDSKSGQLLPYLGGISAKGLDLSRDGRWVVYVLNPEGTLWRAKADGSERQQLTFPPLKGGVPRLSRDGKQIAFMGILPGKGRIYLVPADGGSPQQVTNGEGSDGGDADPAWSPDGSSLAFSGTPNAILNLPGPDKLMLRIINLKTHQVSALSGSENLRGPRWSPDGKYFAAVSPDSQKLVLYNPRTRAQTELASREIGYASWSHDSEFVYFDTLDSDPSFFRVRIRDRKIERIVGLKGIPRSMGTFGAWTGLAPDDSPLIQRDAGTSEIYAFDWDAP
jgi:eukaryotic-like serine/threonine-protein kinase